MSLIKTPTNWGVFVAASLAFANWLWPLPVPEVFRLPLAVIAWLAFAIACCGWGYARIPWRTRGRRKPRRMNPLIAFAVFVVSGALGVGGYFLAVRTASPKTIEDLRVSIIHYGFVYETGELVADVQYVNNGTTRRTITGAYFTLHTPYSPSTERIMLDATIEQHQGVLAPLYVEPGAPIVASYRAKLSTPIEVSQVGNVFGLQIHVLSFRGRKKISNLDALVVGTPESKGALPPLTARIVEEESLDKQ